MRHIKNSDRDGIFILVHQGIPNSIVTEYGEDISEGSLCVDSTNKDLYILKNNVWQKYGVGFNASDFIPLPGTEFNKPVTGNIEISDNVALVNNSSKLIFNSLFLKLESANSSFLVNDNIIYSNKNSVIVNNTSKFNFVTSLFNNNMVINNSGNNKVFMSCLNGDFSIDNSNNNTIYGFNGGAYINYSSNNNSIFNIVYNSNTNDDVYITNNLYSDISAILVPGNTVFVTDNTRLVLDGYMENSSVTTLTESFIQGNVYDSIIATSNNLRVYGDISNSNFNNTAQNTIIGSYINNVTFSQNSSNFIGSGYMNEVDMSQSQSSLYLGYLWKIDINQANQSVLMNVTNYSFTQSTSNFIANSFSSDTSFPSVIKGSNNVYFNIGNIQSVSIPTNNIVFFASEITYAGANKDNIILSRGFKGTIGSNNFITRIGDTPSNSVFGDYNFMFGDISNTSLTNYGNKNIILGTVNLDSTLTNKNVIIGARNVTNINHNNQEENVFINVGNMLVTDTNSVYLPGRIHLVTDNGYDAKIDTVNLSQNNTYLLQDRSGTIALLDDISGSGGDYIKIDGTSTTTAPIPFVEGLVLPNTKLIKNQTATASLKFGDDSVYLESTDVGLNFGSGGGSYGFNLGHDNSSYIKLHASGSTDPITGGYGFGFRVNNNIGLTVGGSNTGNGAIDLKLSTTHGFFVGINLDTLPEHNYLNLLYGTNGIYLTNTNTRISMDLSIGSDIPNTATTLDLQSTTKGVGLPVVTTLPNASRKGNFVYDNANNLRYSDGVNWRTLATVSASTAVAVAYVLYNSTNAASSDTSVSVKGDGSILLPYCSLHYALTILSSSPKSIIVIDSGEKETLPNITYTWNKSITLNNGVWIFASDGNSTSLGQITATSYVFNALDGFSLNGGGTIGLWNRGLVNMAGDVNSSYTLDNITVLYNQIPIHKQYNSLCDIDKCNLWHSNTIGVVQGSSPYLAYSFTTYCVLTTSGSNYSRFNISRCVLNNTVLDVTTNGGYGKIIDSSFYASKASTFSYITFTTIDSDEYNFTSRNNSFDLINNSGRTAFNCIADNCVSINDRIVRCLSNTTADMIGTANKLYCYNLVTPTTAHNSVPKAGATFITTVAGLTIA